jgi:hypothetical protein
MARNPERHDANEQKLMRFVQSTTLLLARPGTALGAGGACADEAGGRVKKAARNQE